MALIGSCVVVLSAQSQVRIASENEDRGQRFLLKHVSLKNFYITIPRRYFPPGDKRLGRPITTKFVRLHVDYPMFRPVYNNPPIELRRSVIWINVSASGPANSAKFFRDYYRHWKTPIESRFAIREYFFDKNLPIAKTMAKIRRLFFFAGDSSTPPVLIICNKEPLRYARCRAKFWVVKRNRYLFVEGNFSFHHLHDWRNIVTRVRKMTVSFL